MWTIRSEEVKDGDIKTPCGHCYEDSYQFIKNNKDWELVHGTVTNGEGKTFPHAWAEKSGQVYDPSTDVTLSADEYYKMLKAKDIKKYKYHDMLVKSVKSGHYGPWE